MYYPFVKAIKNNPTLELDPEELETAALVFKALSDPARLKILAFLASEDAGKCCANEEGICACDLEDVIQLSQPTVSHHMKLLVSANLVLGEKRGKWMFYRIDPAGFKYLKSFIKAWE
jgi:ArsR family transcriptional regulator, arsenate/arsenite/antimonite-responsive transcriptional repressor